MKKLLFTLFLAAPAFAQVTLENWGCDSIVAASDSNPVVFTCNTPHGFANGATFLVGLSGGTGSWAVTNTQWTTQALGSIQQSATTMEIVNAAPQEVGGTVSMPYCNVCLNGGNPENPATVTGIAGNVLTLTRSNPTFHYASAFFFTPGSSGANVILNANRPRSYTATATGPTTFSIPVDSTSFGPFNTGTHRTRRLTGLGVPYGTDYTGANLNPGLVSDVSNGIFTETYPSVPDPANAHQVLAARSGTSSFLSPATLAAGNSVSVSGGIATVTIPASRSPWPFQGDLDRQLVVGSLVYMDGWQDMRLEDAFVVSSVSNPPTAFSFPVGMPDGNYPGIPSGGGFMIAARGTPNPDFQVADNNGIWTFPGGYLQGFIKSGTWDANLNRFYTWMRVTGKNIQRRSNGGYAGSVGTYVKIRPSTTNNTTTQYDEHWYHYFNPNWYDGSWVRVVLNAKAQHQVGGGTWEWPTEPVLNGFAGDTAYLGDSHHYFDSLGRVYFSLSYDTVPDFLGVGYSIGPVTLDVQSAEPDTSVSTVMAIWSPARFTQVNGCRGDGDYAQTNPVCTGEKNGGPGWEVGWIAPIFDNIAYEVRRKSTSIKIGGFSSGLCNDGSTNCTQGNGDVVAYTASVYSGVQWNSSSTTSTYPGDTYFAIRPKFNVNFVSGVGVSPIWLSSHTPMDMAIGDHITIAGVGGNTNANMTNVPITGQTAPQVWYLYDPVGTIVSSMSGSGASPISITTLAPHGISTGQKVRVDGVSGSFLAPPGDSAAWGAWTATVIDSTHLTLDGSTGNGALGPIPNTRVRGPGMLVSVVASGGNCTLNTLSAHGLMAGMKFILVNSPDPGGVLGPSPSTTEVVRTVVTIPTSTSFTFACAGVTDGTYNTQANPNYAFAARIDGAVSVAGTGNANWTSGGTIVSSEDFKNFTEVYYGNPPAPGSPVVTTLSLPAWTVGVAYSQTLTASGGTAPYTWSIASGGLPAGLTLDSNTGAISGTPTVAAASPFVAAVTDSLSAAGESSLSILINPAVSVTTSALPDGARTVAYSQTLSAAGGTGADTWSIISGGLPAGLSLNASTGVISGIPSAAGMSIFTVTATDTVGSAASKSLSISVPVGRGITVRGVTLRGVTGH